MQAGCLDSWPRPRLCCLYTLYQIRIPEATKFSLIYAGRTPGQLAEAAAVLFDTLRLVEAHEFTTQQGALHFAAALQVCVCGRRRGCLGHEGAELQLAAVTSSICVLVTTTVLLARVASWVEVAWQGCVGLPLHSLMAGVWGGC